MTRLRLDISMSLDGFIAGPNQTLEQPLGEGGERLHEWAVGLASFRERHGLAGGEVNPDSQIVEEGLAATGAVVMGRRMFSGGDGPWEADPNADGWWGDEPPFRVPVFVLTRHARETVIKQGGTSFTFVTDGIEAALEQARAAAGDKDVLLAGGANAVQQYLKAGLLDEVQIHLVPVLLGGGVRLFEGLGPDPIELETVRVIESPAVTHLTLRATGREMQ
jgi:dihydrofolate reductase